MTTDTRFTWGDDGSLTIDQQYETPYGWKRSIVILTREEVVELLSSQPYETVETSQDGGQSL